MDRVLVIVNEEVITQSEFDYRMQTVLAEIKKDSDQPPPPDLSKQLIDGMVSDRVQLQEARRRGITITDDELDRAIQNFAAQQNFTVQQLIISLQQRGETIERFRETVRDSLTISRLTEFYARSRVVVPDYEIEGFLAQNKIGDSDTEYQIAHILMKNPEQNLALAESLVNQIRDGLSFQQAVLNYSVATDAQEGGVLGWRRPEQLPEVFSEAIKTLSVGEVTDVLQSTNGLHILKLLDVKGQRNEVVQNDVRHILISASSQVARAQASKRLSEIRQRILDGEDFSSLARIYSDDSVSAANGGGLGWVSPGEMVREFEETFKQSAIGEVSPPFATQYGVHILQVLDRREKNITDQLMRSRADNFLRRRRAEREFQQWVRELREQAYIEFVSEPV